MSTVTNINEELAEIKDNMLNLKNEMRILRDEIIEIKDMLSLFIEDNKYYETSTNLSEDTKKNNSSNDFTIECTSISSMATSINDDSSSSIIMKRLLKK